MGEVRSGDVLWLGLDMETKRFVSFIMGTDKERVKRTDPSLDFFCSFVLFIRPFALPQLATSSNRFLPCT